MSVEFEEPRFIISPAPASEVPGMAGWLIRKTGGKLSPAAANAILFAFALACFSLAIAIPWIF